LLHGVDRESFASVARPLKQAGFGIGAFWRYLCRQSDLSAREITRPKTMTDMLPDRLSVNPDSPYYDAEVLAKDIGIRFKGVDKTNVEEYCVSEGWIKVAAGAAKDRFGRPMTITLKGPVEPYFRKAE
jgi:hypothetical protein